MSSYFDGNLVFTMLTLTEKEIIMNFITKFIREEDGVTAIEYGLIAALIATVIILAVTMVGARVCATFNEVGVAMGGTAAVCTV